MLPQQSTRVWVCCMSRTGRGILAHAGIVAEAMEVLDHQQVELLASTAEAIGEWPSADDCQPAFHPAESAMKSRTSRRCRRWDAWASRSCGIPLADQIKGVRARISRSSWSLQAALVIGFEAGGEPPSEGPGRLRQGPDGSDSDRERQDSGLHSG